MTLYTDELLISVDSHHFIHDSLQIRVIDKCSLTLLSFMNIYTAILLNIIFSAGLRDYLLPSTDYNQVWAIWYLRQIQAWLSPSGVCMLRVHFLFKPPPHITNQTGGDRIHVRFDRIYPMTTNWLLRIFIPILGRAYSTKHVDSSEFLMLPSVYSILAINRYDDNEMFCIQTGIDNGILFPEHRTATIYWLHLNISYTCVRIGSVIPKIVLLILNINQ